MKRNGCRSFLSLLNDFFLLKRGECTRFLGKMSGKAIYWIDFRSGIYLGFQLPCVFIFNELFHVYLMIPLFNLKQFFHFMNVDRVKTENFFLFSTLSMFKFISIFPSFFQTDTKKLLYIN